MPDNQEVFANADTDQCIIIELLQYEDTIKDTDSAQYFFNEIANSNGCAPGDVSMLHTEVVPKNAAADPKVNEQHSTSIVVGDQRVAKFKEGEAAKNIVRVYIGNIR